MKTAKLLHSSLVGSTLIAVTLFTGMKGPTPAHAIDPVTAGVVAGIGVELVKGIAKKLEGLSKPVVWCLAKTDGPHAAQGQDAAANGDGDVLDNMLDLEWYLDADTGIVEGYNHGEINHEAWGDIHYHYENGAWRPNPITGSNDDEAWWVFAWARPDGKPDPGKDNTTAAGALCVFSISGPLSDTEWNKWKKRADNDTAKPGAKQLNPTNKQVTEVPEPGGTPVRVESQAGLYFSPDRFRFNDLETDRVRITPTGGPLFVDLFHTNAMLGGVPALIPNSFAGASERLQDLVVDAMQQIEGYSDGLAVFDPDPNKRADLTLAGAALSLGTGEYDRSFADGTKKNPYDLLLEYFNDPNAVQIVAPTQAQARYVPKVICRESVFGAQTVSCPKISDDLRTTIMPARLDGGETRSVENLVGIVVAVSGTLEDAVNLAANTPGTEIAEISDAVEPGAEFNLDLTYAQSGSGFADSLANNTTCFGFEFNPLTETFENLCDNNLEFIVPSEEETHDQEYEPGALELNPQPGVEIELDDSVGPLVFKPIINPVDSNPITTVTVQNAPGESSR